MSTMPQVNAQGPALPYNGTSGFSGTSTSEARATERDKSWQTGNLQRGILNWVAGNLGHGVTIKELRDVYDNDHHGTLSGALSVLHKTGRIVRLSEVRDRCKVYVLPEYVNGREIEPHGRTRKVPLDLTDTEAIALARVNSAVEMAEGIGTSMISVPTEALKGLVAVIERNL